MARSFATTIALAGSVLAPFAGTPSVQSAPKPHPLIQPYAGSSIDSAPKVSSFEEYDLLTGRLVGGKPAPSKRVEGKLTTFYLNNPKDRSPLEIFRNYEAAFKEAGFATLYACRGPECGDQRGIEGVHYVPYSDDSRYGAFARSDASGQVHVAMQVQPLYTYIAIVEGKPMDTGMAKVTADALGKDILKDGHAAVYDILFDTGKADVKPESAAALEQIALLLQKNPSLTLFVVGHTDNVGTLTGNLDLSKRRAAAVVTALTTKHGIAAARLKADGVGPLAPVATNDNDAGRAKNRRVELVKQ